MLIYPKQSTTYQILARGEGGTVAAQQTVEVLDVPVLTSVTVPAGTQLAVRLVDALNTGQNRPGDVFRATLDQPIVVDGRAIAPRYAEVLGRIDGLASSGRVSGVAQLSLVLYQIKIGGQLQTIYTDPIHLAARPERGRDAAKVATGAAIGAIIGAIAGGGKGAATGAAAGAGAGTGVALATKGKELILGPETQLTFRLGQGLNVRISP
jgi:hypothetical protein